MTTLPHLAFCHCQPQPGRLAFAIEPDFFCGPNSSEVTQ